MKEKPTKEQQRELWEQCGCRFEERKFHDKQHGAEFVGSDWAVTYCVGPDGREEVVDYPPADLNNLFRYAVPKAIAKLEDRFGASTNSIRGLQLLFKKWLDKIYEGYSIEDALLSTLQEVIYNG